jgi:hypothetical protein
LREDGTEAEVESAQAEEREDGGGLHRVSIFDRSSGYRTSDRGFEFSKDSISSRRALKKLYPFPFPTTTITTHLPLRPHRSQENPTQEPTLP